MLGEKTSVLRIRGSLNIPLNIFIFYRPIKNLGQAYDFIIGQPHLNGSLGPDAQFIEVDKIYVHPNYTGNENQYEWTPGMDIAVLKMKEPYVINDYVRTVCVPPKSYENFFFGGISCTVTGWGATRAGG